MNAANNTNFYSSEEEIDPILSESNDSEEELEPVKEPEPEPEPVQVKHIQENKQPHKYNFDIVPDDDDE